MRDLLIATRNEHKMAEIRSALEGIPFRLVDINDVPGLDGFEPEETGSTFEENATLKARAYGERANMLTLADDSGLMVDALDGEPGVKSARFVSGTDKDRNDKILELLKDVPDEKRAAVMTSTIAIFDPANDTLRVCEYDAKGRIMREPRGARLFGYDPIFFYDDAGKTGGEMQPDEKNRYSHRGRALAKAREILLKEFV